MPTEKKCAEIREIDTQMKKEFFCGSCCLGLENLEEYKEHNSTEEHTYHITRRLTSMVPGLGFCPACSCIMQTKNGWEGHVSTEKHLQCIKSLNAIGLFGEYMQPLGCSTPGQLGLPIDPIEINQKVSITYGYGHGGKLAKGVPLIGMNHVKELKSGGTYATFKNEGHYYMCDTCDEKFTFEHRSSHMAGKKHRLAYMEKHYPEWHSDASSISEDFRMQLNNRLMFYAHKIELEEMKTETEESTKIRNKFVNTTTKRKEYNIGVEKERFGRPATGGRPVTGGYRGGRPAPDRGYEGGRFRGDRYDSLASDMGRRRPGLMEGIPGPYAPRRFPSSTMPNRLRGPQPRPVFEGYCGDMDHGLGKRSAQYPPIDHRGSMQPKKFRQDPYAEAGTIDQLEHGIRNDQYEIRDPYEKKGDDMSKALEAIQVLEDFAVGLSPAAIKEKISSMKKAVLSGNNPSELNGSKTVNMGNFSSRGGRGRGNQWGMHPRPGPNNMGPGGPGPFGNDPYAMGPRGPCMDPWMGPMHPGMGPRGMFPRMPFDGPGMPFGGPFDGPPPPRSTLPRGVMSRGRGMPRHMLY